MKLLALLADTKRNLHLTREKKEIDHRLHRKNIDILNLFYRLRYMRNGLIKRYSLDTYRGTSADGYFKLPPVATKKGNRIKYTKANLEQIVDYLCITKKK